MYSLLRSTYSWTIAAIGGLAGVAAWALGPAVTLALATGLGTAGALLFAQWFRLRQRWIGTEIRQLRELQTGAERRQAGQLLARDFEGWRRQWSAEHDWLRRQFSILEKRATEAGNQQIVQVQALQNLYAMVPVRGRMPPLDGGWAVSPDFMLLLLSLVQEQRPATVVELGSGASTVWAALLLREQGLNTRIVAVDHDLTYGEITRERLATLGLDKLVELRHAPLVELELDGETYPWYDRSAFLDVESCDLLVVDGPPGKLRPRSRYPALPVLGDRMQPGAQVLLDDYRRSEEREIGRAHV